MVLSRIQKLRDLFSKYKINGYIVPSNDEYLSEYTPNYAKRLEYLTGFTGSNGIAVVLKNDVLFFTDGRYIEQSKLELDTALFSIFNIHELLDFPFAGYGNPELGYDPRLVNNTTIKHFASLSLKPTLINLIDEIWQNQPAKPASEVHIYPIECAGQSYTDKLNICHQTLNKYAASSLIITAIDSICWLLNIRGNDAPFCPVILGTLLINHSKICFFTNTVRIPKLLQQIRPQITFLPEEKLTEVFTNLTGKILIEERASVFIMDLIKNHDVQTIKDPCQLHKACKNSIEIEHSINSHIKDAVAICELLSYVSSFTGSCLTEFSLGVMLTDFRAKQSNYVMDSFPTICGFKENSAIIHYQATNDKAKTIADSGILLIDSGAHYNGATTDITRTISIGSPTSLQKTLYTKVLKGHIALATIKFPVNTTGSNLDVLARQFLWSECKNYEHGTGHGVGNFLSVHEGPQSINPVNHIPLKPGMILSNEPGYYIPGEFGIRIENLMYVKNADCENWMEFEQLTLIPYSQNLLDPNLLTPDEISYLKNYYKKIKALVYPLLSNAAQKWLKDEILWY